MIVSLTFLLTGLSIGINANETNVFNFIIKWMINFVAKIPMNFTSSLKPKDFYQNKMESLGLDLSQAKKKRNFVSIALITVFILLAWSIYHYFTSDRTAITLVIPILSGIGFIVLSRIDSRFLGKIDYLIAQIECNQKELDYLNGDFSALDKGEEFIDANHAYSNDLDVFGEESLFQVINRSITPNGKACMADTLLNPCLDKSRIEGRQEATQELITKMDWYQKFLVSGRNRRITRTSDDLIQQWKKLPTFFKSKKSRRLIYCSNIIMLLMIVLGFFQSRFIGIGIVWFLGQLMVALMYSSRINKLNEELGKFIKAVGNYFYLVKVVHEVHFSSRLLVQIEKELFSESNALQAFSSLNSIQNGLESRANLLVTVLFDGLFLNDMHLVQRLEKWREIHVNDIDKWIAAINRMEVLVSMANFRFNHPDYAVPQPNGDRIIDAESLGHPLLSEDQMVTNNFRTGALNELYIVTGANMAGKSTFLRSVGVNMVLALTGNVVCAKRFSFMPIQLFTSMRTTDNLAKGTSYFHAELLRLKALIERVGNDRPHFIILDEMLKGTNSKDKLNGSIKFLNRLLSLPVSGLVATHDLALGKLAEENPQHYFNICFEIEHTDSDIIYDYKLKKGVSKNMNASILMEQMGLI